MSVKVKGMQDMIDSLDKMLKVGDKTAKKALEGAGEIVKRKEIEVAQREHSKWSDDVGYKELKRYPVKFRGSGSRVVSIGIKTKISGKQKTKEQKDSMTGVHRATHWDKIKGLWFNNYGFFHNKTGRYIAGSNWMDTAYDESVDKAYKKIREEIEKDLELK